MPIFPPVPKDLTKSFVQTVHPTRWEHLGGPHSWYKFVESGNPIETSEAFGLTARIETHGPFGRIAEGYRLQGNSPFRAVLQAGPQGVGKSAAAELLIRTHVAKRGSRTNVTLPSPQGPVTLVDNAGNPYPINPPNSGRSSETLIRTLLASASKTVDEAERQAEFLQFFNAGPIGKQVLDELADSLSRTDPHNRHRAVLVSEFDNLEKRQVPSLKVALDPRNAPERLLFLADTNDLESVFDALGNAGRERFEVIRIRAWQPSELAAFAVHYLRAIHVGVDGPNPIETAATTLAELCGGSLRALVLALDKLRARAQAAQKDLLLSIEDLESCIVVPDSKEAVSTLAAQDYLRQARNGPSFVPAFCAGRAHTFTSVHNFGTALATALFQSDPRVLATPTADRVFQAAQRGIDGGRPAPEIHWAAMVHPLSEFAAELQASRPTKAAPISSGAVHPFGS